MGDEEVDDEVEDEEDVSNDIHVACPSLPGLIFCFTWTWSVVKSKHRFFKKTYCKFEQLLC